MKERIKKYLSRIITCCLVLGTLTSSAATHPKASTAAWKQLTKDPAFGYKNEKELIAPPSPSSGYLSKLLENIFAFFTSHTGIMILWIILFAILIYAGYKILANNGGLIFRKTRKPAGDKEPEDALENLADTDWERHYQRAITENNLRLAVRYSYMLLLNLLEQRQLISFRTDKTNFDYYRELEHSDHRQPFRTLSRQYEYTWYGNYAITQEAFSNYLETFNNLKKQLHF